MKYRAPYALVLLSFSAAVHSAIVEYIYDGEVATIRQNLSDQIVFGDTVTGSFRFDTNNFKTVTTSSSSFTDGTSSINSSYTFDAGDAFNISLKIQTQGGSFVSATSNAGTVELQDATTAQGDVIKLTSASGSIVGDQIRDASNIFRDVRQIDVFFQDGSGSIFDQTGASTSVIPLPTDIPSLTAADQAFFQVSLDTPGTFTGFNVNLTEVKTILSTPVSEVDLTEGPTEIFVSPDQLINGAGGVSVDVPDNVTGTISASYSQQAAEELDFSIGNFAIAGEIYQIWDIDLDATEIPDGQFIEVVLSYDDTFMTLADEFALGVLRILDDGTIDGLLEVKGRNTVDNQITVLTPGFSSLATVIDPARVPVPAPLALLVLGLVGLSLCKSKVTS